MARKNLRKKLQKACVGHMRDRIKLQNRDITAPIFNSADFAEVFTDNTEVWATVNTVNGKTFFDGVNSEKLITHEIIIRHDPSVTAETWVLYKNRRVDILEVTDLDERGEYMKLICNERGNDTQEASRI